MVKKSKISQNLKKSQKNIFPFFILKKKLDFLSFPMLGGPHSTRSLSQKFCYGNTKKRCQTGYIIYITLDPTHCIKKYRTAKKQFKFNFFSKNMHLHSILKYFQLYYRPKNSLTIWKLLSL